MKKTYLAIILILVAITLISFFGDNQGESGESLKVGVVFPLSGPAAVWGESMKGGVELAKRDLEEQGVKVEIVYEDGEANPSKSVSAFNKLVDIDGVDVVLSALSGPTVPLVELAEEKGVPLIGIGLANEEFAVSSNYAYRVYTTNSEYADKIVSAINESNYKNIGLLTRADEYGESLSKIINEDLSKKGVSVAEEKILPTDTDYRTQIQKLKDSGVELVVFTGITPQELTNFASQKKVLFDESRLIIAGLQLSIDSTREELKDLVDGSQSFVFPYAMNNKEFQNKYENVFGQKPIFAATFGYDALMFASLPIQNGYKYGSIQEGLQKVVNNIDNMEGMSGDIKISKEGEINTEVSIATLKDGEFVEAYLGE